MLITVTDTARAAGRPKPSENMTRDTDLGDSEKNEHEHAAGNC
jgi:hypothetical protein